MKIKIAQKYILLLAVYILYAVIVVTVFSDTIYKLNKQIIDLNEKWLPTEKYLKNVQTAYAIQIIDFTNRCYIGVNDWDEAAIEKLNRAKSTADENWEKYYNLPKTWKKYYKISEKKQKEIKKLIKEATELQKSATATFDKIVATIQKGENSETRQALKKIITDEIYTTITPYINKTNQITELQFNVNQAIYAEHKSKMKTVVIILIFVVFSVITSGTYISIKLSRGVRKNLDDLNRYIGETSKDIVNGNIKSNINIEKINFEFHNIATGINNALNSVVKYIDNIPMPVIIVNNELDILYLNNNGQTLINTTEDSTHENVKCYDIFTGKNWTAENCIITNAIEKNEAFITETSLNTEEKTIEAKIYGNPIEDSHNNVVGCMINIIDQTTIKNLQKLTNKLLVYQETEITKITENILKLAEGDINFVAQTGKVNDDKLIKSEQKIDTINKALNKSTQAIQKLVEDMQLIVQAVSNGDLETRVNAERHHGKYKELITLINSSSEVIKAPFNTISQIINKIAYGEIPENIQTPYKGEYNIVINNLNRLSQVNRQIIKAMQQIAIGDFDIKLVMRSGKDELVKAINEQVAAMKSIRDLAIKISQGELTVNVQPRSDKDETLIAFKGMVERLDAIVSSVFNVSNELTNTSKDISSNSQTVSQGASEQASSVEEVSSSMEEMVSNIEQNTENAQITERMATKSADGILIGSKNVNQTVSAMEQIAEKVSVISDIAFQTNILALNAAIEAARAGEHGKGFAVVAAEVRKLAEKTQISAGEISELSSRSVNIAQKSGKLLSSIVPDIQKNAKLVQEITASSIEQRRGAEQINRAINQLNEVAQHNASSSEDMATSAEELNNRSTQLLDLVSNFKINANENKLTSKKQPTKTTTKTKENNQNNTSGIEINLGKNFNENDEYERF